MRALYYMLDPQCFCWMLLCCFAAIWLSVTQAPAREIWVVCVGNLLFSFSLKPMVFFFVQRLREEMEEITQQQLVHDKYCKDLMGFSTKPRHITPFTSFQSLQPSQSNALAGLLGYSAHQGIMGFATSPVPAKSTLVESRCCRDLMEEKFDQVSVCSSTCLRMCTALVLVGQLSSMSLLSRQCCLALNRGIRVINYNYPSFVPVSQSKWFTFFGSSVNYPSLRGSEAKSQCNALNHSGNEHLFIAGNGHPSKPNLSPFRCASGFSSAEPAKTLWSRWQFSICYRGWQLSVLQRSQVMRQMVGC